MGKNFNPEYVWRVVSSLDELFENNEDPEHPRSVSPTLLKEHTKLSSAEQDKVLAFLSAENVVALHYKDARDEGDSRYGTIERGPKFKSNVSRFYYEAKDLEFKEGQYQISVELKGFQKTIVIWTIVLVLTTIITGGAVFWQAFESHRLAELSLQQAAPHIDVDVTIPGEQETYFTKEGQGTSYFKLKRGTFTYKGVDDGRSGIGPWEWDRTRNMSVIGIRFPVNVTIYNTGVIPVRFRGGSVDGCGPGIHNFPTPIAEEKIISPGEPLSLNYMIEETYFYLPGATCTMTVRLGFDSTYEERTFAVQVVNDDGSPIHTFALVKSYSLTEQGSLPLGVLLLDSEEELRAFYDSNKGLTRI